MGKKSPILTSFESSRTATPVSINRWLQNDEHSFKEHGKDALLFLRDIYQISRIHMLKKLLNYINPGYGLSLVDTLWNASSYRQPLEQEGNPMT